MPFANPDEKRAYMAQWMWERRERWVKANGPCRDCGGSDRLRIFGLGRGGIWGYTESKREKILAGCVVLCHGCWRKRPGAGARLHEGVSHGTILGYKHYRCRCDECKRANRERVAIQRARMRETVAKPDEQVPAKKLDEALDALASIWMNAREASDELAPWTRQRARVVLQANAARLNPNRYPSAEWKRIVGGAPDQPAPSSSSAVREI